MQYVQSKGLPDLTAEVGALTFNGIALPSEQANLSVTLTNQGGLSVRHPVTAKIFAQAAPGSAANNGADRSSPIEIGELTFGNLKLSPGERKKVSAAVKLPDTLLPGEYNIFVAVDTKGNVPEANEANNVIAASYTQTVAWKFGNFGGENRSLTLADDDGDTIRYQLKGDGYGEITALQGKRQLTLYGTSDRSEVVIQSNGNGHVLDNVVVGGDLKRFNAQNTDLHGNLTINGSLEKLELDDVSDAQVTIGPSTNPNRKLEVALGDVSNLSLRSAVGINELKAAAWTTSAGQNNLLIAPEIKEIDIKGDFNTNLSVAGNLETIKVKGMASGIWTVGQNNRLTRLESSTAAGWSLSVGGSLNYLDVQANLQGTVAAKSMERAFILGNVSNAKLLIGANLGANGVIGGGDDIYGQGELKELIVHGNVSSSVIGAGLDPFDTSFTNGNEQLIAGGKINLIDVRGTVSTDSLFAAEIWPKSTSVKINGQTVNSETDARFLTRSKVAADVVAPVVTLTLAEDTGNATDRLTSVATVVGTVTDKSAVVALSAGFGATPVNDYVDIFEYLQDGRFTLDAATLATILGKPLTDDSYQISVVAKDALGNVSAPTSYSYNLDRTAPTLSLVSPQANGTHGGDIHLVGTVDEAVTVSTSLDGADAFSFTVDSAGELNQQVRSQSLATGAHQLALTVTDVAGNSSQTTVDFTVDPSFEVGSDPSDNSGGNSYAFSTTTSTEDIRLAKQQAEQLWSFEARAGGTTTYEFAIGPNGAQPDLHQQAEHIWENGEEITWSLQVEEQTVRFIVDGQQITYPLAEARSLNALSFYTKVNTTNKNKVGEGTSMALEIRSINGADLNSPLLLSSEGPNNGQDLDQLFVSQNGLISSVSGIARMTWPKDAPNPYLENSQGRVTFHISGYDYKETPTSGIVLQENDDFSPTYTQAITVPDAPSSIRFIFDADFDTASIGEIRDAFEVALLDPNGRSLVHTISSDKDVFFNLTEGIAQGGAAGVSINGNEITLDISNLAPGTEAQLVFRLVNNDDDTQTTVRINAIEVEGIGGSNSISITPPRSSSVTQAVDFARLEDVSGWLTPAYGRTSFNDDTAELAVEIAVQNVSTYPVRDQLVMVVDSISDLSVSVVNPDGRTPDGKAYFNLSSLLGDEALAGGKTSEFAQLVFRNPNQVQFDYEVSFLSKLNAAPEFVSAPNREALVGKPYRYDADATDTDGDGLTYSLVTGPEGLTIDEKTGEMVWNPTATDLGTTQITVLVEDGHGGIGEQTYTLTVKDSVPNRPPVITTTPITDATIGEPYLYKVVARDADGDDLIYQLLNSTSGMTINADTGEISWLPNAEKLGIHEVTIQVTDGKGGAALQRYSLLVVPSASNTAPIFTSNPNTLFNLPGRGNLANGAVDPTRIDLDLALNEKTTQTISLTLPTTALSGFADIVFVIDESGSMATAQEWIGNMVLDLEAALKSAGITSNRYALAGFGGANQREPGHLFNVSNSGVLTLTQPDNQVESSAAFGPVASSLFTTLLEDGSYLVTVNGNPGNFISDYSFDVESLAILPPVLSSGFGEFSGSIFAGQEDATTFTASAGTLVYLDGKDSSQNLMLRLEDPDGSQLFLDRATKSFGPLLLKQSGAYTLTVRGQGTSSIGGYRFSVTDLSTVETLPLDTIVSDRLEILTRQ